MIKVMSHFFPLFLLIISYFEAGKSMCLKAWSKACNLFEKRLQRRCFPMKFVKFLRTTILKNIWELLLTMLNMFRLSSSKLDLHQCVFS